MSYKNIKESLEIAYPTLVLKENEALSAHTTFKIGGTCPLMAFPSTEEEFLACIKAAEKEDIPCIPIGNGSNLLVSDQGYSAFFLHTRELNEIKLLNENTIQVQSGCLLGKLAHFVAKHQLTGLEFAQGIPGSVGGGIVMNAGAYGGELCQVVKSVTSYSFENKELITRTVDLLDFSYRHSLFSTKKEVILSAILELPQGNGEKIQETMKQFATQRKEKQPLDFPSCGSTFKRPPNHFAAALIDQCGLKGFTVGQAQISEKHAGFVINLGGATCVDILQLVEEVKTKVLAETGVLLELEVQLLKESE